MRRVMNIIMSDSNCLKWVGPYYGQLSIWYTFGWDTLDIYVQIRKAIWNNNSYIELKTSSISVHFGTHRRTGYYCKTKSTREINTIFYRFYIECKTNRKKMDLIRITNKPQQSRTKFWDLGLFYFNFIFHWSRQTIARITPHSGGLFVYCGAICNRNGTFLICFGQYT